MFTSETMELVKYVCLLAFFVALFGNPASSLKKCNNAKRNRNHKRTASPEDIKIAQKTWPQINENAEANGVAILKAFLDKFNYYSMFKKFEGLKHDDSIKENKVFKTHARMIMANLNSAIMNADTPKAQRILKALGQSHEKKGVTKQHVDNLFAVIEDTIKSAFGFTPRQLTAWHNVLELLSGFMKEGLSK